MNLNDLIKRAYTTKAWEAGDKIPWNDPEFSLRILHSHLAQDSDWASRRQELIEVHLAWLQEHLAPGSSILDLACGPGLYTQRLAEMGHKCRGVDFSPASISYARDRAAEKNLSAEYVLEDIRLYQSPDRFDCVLFIFGEFNVFTEADARLILDRAAGFLRPGGLFVLEVHTFEAVRETGLCPPTWWTCEQDAGLMSTRPHLCLQENNWDEAASTATTRYFLVDAETSELKMFSTSMTGYTMGRYEQMLGRYEQMLSEAGFHSPEVLSPEQWPKGGPFEGVMTTLSCLKS